MTGETEVVEDCGHPILDTLGNMAVRLMEVTRERDTALDEVEHFRAALKLEVSDNQKERDAALAERERLTQALLLACGRIADGPQEYSEAKTANDWADHYLGALEG